MPKYGHSLLAGLCRSILGVSPMFEYYSVVTQFAARAGFCVIQFAVAAVPFLKIMYEP